MQYRFAVYFGALSKSARRRSGGTALTCAATSCRAATEKFATSPRNGKYSWQSQRIYTLTLEMGRISGLSYIRCPAYWILMVSCQQEWGSGFVRKKTDPGLCTSNEGRFLKVYGMNILDNFKTLLSCFHTFGVRRTIDVLDSENQPGAGSVKIRTGDVWHQRYENKREGLKSYLKYSFNTLLKNSLSLTC